MKLTLQEKIDIINLYEDSISFKEIGEKYSINTKTARWYVSVYQYHGIDIFKEKIEGKNNRYDKNLKQEYVKRYKNGETLRSLCTELAVQPSLIASWIKKI